MSYRYPYGNTEQLNLDWFLNQWEKFKADWAEAEAGIDGSLDAEIAKVEAAMSELYAARDAAAASASAARQSSLDAAAAQVAAGNSKTAAQAAETSARGSQQAAAQSAQEAQASAQGAENSALTATQAANTATQQAAGADAAKGAAEAAQQAAEDAQAAAAQSAGQAGQAATAAGDHADDAADSATLAQQAAQDMSDSVEQITTNKNDISDLKESITQLYVPSENLYNPATDRHGKTITGGVVVDNEGTKLSDYIYIGNGGKVTVPLAGASAGVIRVFFYTDKNESALTRGLYVQSTPAETFTLSSTESYIVLLMYEASTAFMVNKGETLLPYVPYGAQAGSIMEELLQPVNERIDDIDSRFVFINLFDKTTITSNSYINPSDGNVMSGNGFFASDFIDISKYDTIKVSKTHLFALYKNDKTYLSSPSETNSISHDLTVDVRGASYIKFSSWDSQLNFAQIGENITSDNYVAFGDYALPNLVSLDNTIIVDITGNGDYTSFTEAVYETVDDRKNILVKPGTYDIVAEYVALFDQSAVDNMADADSAIFNGFQYGVVLRNRKIEFASGAHLVCDWAGHTVDDTHRFSALAVGYNVEIIGLDLDCTATFYCVHDDYGIDTPYTVKYENCRIIGHNISNVNCIGGGCKKYSRHILKNCYFDNNTDSSTVVRYHNTNADGAEPEVYVSNCYFGTYFKACWYGTQTSKMKVYVNNCKAKSIDKEQESSSYTTDNIDLYKWCNEENS